MLAVGTKHVGKRAEVTVSVSSHVPKPHTPFQWCAQDVPAEIRRKQQVLRDTLTQRSLRLKYHNWAISYLEGVVARGDRRVADVIELAWKKGARFDGWDELFELDTWLAAMKECGLEPEPYLATRPISARLPWDHIDVGLEDGFLLQEYRKAVKSRLSPPCGKVAGHIIHHTNLREAEADSGKLVCYDCGVACDLSKMRADRLVHLRALGAQEPVPPRPLVRAASAGKKDKSGRRRPTPSFPDVPHTLYRMRFTKVGRAAFLGHLDTVRVLARTLRRAGIDQAYSRGFHPKPIMAFGPALALGVASFGELVDLGLEGRPDPGELFDRLREVTPEGNELTGLWLIEPGAPKLSALIDSYDLLVVPVALPGAPRDEAALARIGDRFLAMTSVEVARKDKLIDVRALVQELAVVDAATTAKLCGALDAPVAPAALRVKVSCTAEGSAKPAEVAKALGLWGPDDPRASHATLARLGFRGIGLDAEHGVALAAAPGVTTFTGFTSIEPNTSEATAP
jgi:radical SAM-linked protein